MSGSGETTSPPEPGKTGVPFRRADDSDLAPRTGPSGEAMREMARAFQTSAEAMEGVRRLQVELVQTLKRQDRSEMMLQSTQALNDSFRNLASIQRELLDRLEREKAGRRGGRLVPLMLLGLLVVFLGGVFVVLDVLEQMRGERGDFTRAVEQSSDRDLAAYREGRAEGEEEAGARTFQLEADLQRWRDRADAWQRKLEDETASRAELLAEKRGLEAELDRLAQQVLAAQNEVMARRLLEEEVHALNAQLAASEPRLLDLERELERERADSRRLRDRLAALGYGLPDPGPGGLPPAPGTPAVPSEDPPAGESPYPPPTELPQALPSEGLAAPGSRFVERDPRLLEKIRSRINEMLETGGRGRPDLWQVTRIEGVASDRLDGVIALRYERSSGRLIEQVSARDLRFRVRRDLRQVELEFRAGSLTRGGSTQPLAGDVLRQIITGGEMTRLWTGSGLSFVQVE